MTIENLILQLENVLKTKSDFYCVDVSNILSFYRSSDWDKYEKIKEETYNKEVVFKNNIFEVIIITWDKGQEASVHDHADNGCWMKVLKGSLEEKLYDKDLKLEKTHILKKGHLGFMDNDKGYHSISNINDDVTVSLHIYNPPNHNTKYF